jgi:hypothetical protein
MGKYTLKEFFMKNKKPVLVLILITAIAISAYAQQYDSESDFQIDWDKNVKDGVAITKYLGSKREIRIPSSIQNVPVVGIESRAFERKNITRVIIPNGVRFIYPFAFSNCESLTSVTIPNSVTRIEARAFEDCDGLTSVTFQGTITSNNFSNDTRFPGDLREKHLASGGGPGTYTRSVGGREWRKQ